MVLLGTVSSPQVNAATWFVMCHGLPAAVSKLTGYAMQAAL
jgi:hypothetical protein